jgi:PKD repeat protein
MGISDTTIADPIYDSTWTINGRQLYKYNLPSAYTLSAPGIYPVQVVAQNPSSDGCSGDQVIDYELQVFAPPVVNFSFSSNGCLTDSVHFLGTVNTGGRNIISYSWDFGDGNMEVTQNAVHLYQAANSYPVKYSVITDIGCFSDTVQQTVPISLPPIANFAVSTPAVRIKF